MKCLYLCVLFLCGASLGLPESRDSEDFITANLNDYIDYVMPAITNFILNNGLDPMEIPDFKEGFSYKPLLITYHGELELTKGILHNMKSLKRSGNVNVFYLNRLLKIRGDFGIDKIAFDYNYKAKVMNIGPKGKVSGSLSKASFVADILIDFNSNELHLQEFYMYNVGTINVKLSGNILTDLLANTFIKIITTLFKNVILKIVESNMREALQDKINEINSSIGAQKFLDNIASNNYDMYNI